MKLLNIDLASNLTAIPDTTHVDPIKEVVEKYAGMTAMKLFLRFYHMPFRSA